MNAISKIDLQYFWSDRLSLSSCIGKELCGGVSFGKVLESTGCSDWDQWVYMQVVAVGCRAPVG